MDDIVGRFASVLERRFILVSLLPSLIFFGGIALLYGIVTESLPSFILGWGQLPASIQISVILGSFAGVWFIAGFLNSQLRNIVQLFEGYYLVRYLPAIGERAQRWHIAQRDAISSTDTVSVEQLPEALRNSPPEQVAASAAQGTQFQMRQPGGFSEEPWMLYSGEEGEVLPTRLGNIIRAAEDYAFQRYGADYLKVWPRLAHMCSTRFIQDYEIAQSNMEFLLVISFYSALFGSVGGLIEIFNHATPLAFLLTSSICFVLSAIAYNTAVEAAKEYAESIRASMDLFRFRLLGQMRFGSPASPEAEREVWSEIDAHISGTQPRRSQYVEPTGSEEADEQ